MLPSHDRFPYSAIVSRPTFSWPEGRGLAFYVAVCVESFAYNAAGLGTPLTPGHSHPNNFNWSWREYGNRVGSWRLIELFDAFQLPMTVLLNSACYEHCPELVAAHRARGDEIVGHGRTNSENQNGLSREDERRLLREATDAFRRHEGKAPRGWMSPGANANVCTEDLLAQEGYRYTLDWPMDDQPVWMKTEAGPLLSVPYPHELNDIPAMIFHDSTARDFTDTSIDNFDEMLRQSEQQPLVFGITVHNFIAGQPFRLKQFRRLLEHITRHRDAVWFTTAGAIADHYASVVPPPSDARPG
ncbi:polysaccharide deacetylase family protein [Reyranella sp. CPCC 100927]|uniref:polysaccharide deacetylase family protein n=1 Tax=Reyranella sp. CPCC 100927 TaxID=2599616 RepID=UPI0011B64839|nr:polysaccharide deacetylase family protein [Reyranella sp. CPCC 100927]TWT10264.1 polysaccharide deacetylase family protein [Reyranella sp. CPCC 100927]